MAYNRTPFTSSVWIKLLYLVIATMILEKVPAKDVPSKRNDQSGKFILQVGVCLKHTYLDIIKMWMEVKLNHNLGNRLQVCANNLEYPILNQELNKWFSVPNRKVLVYSAFYERRQNADGPSIRIIAAGYQAAYNTIGDLYCRMWYPGRHLAVSVLAQYKVIYPSTMHPDMWCSHFIICKLPKNIPGVPHTVTVSPNHCSDTNNHLKVLNREPRRAENTFGVCISPVYQNYRNWTTLIEMFEIHKQLGAREILTYNNAAHEDSIKVFNSYIEDPLEMVNVLPWKVPFHIAIKTNVNIQRAALNDCLYRLGHRHKFVTIQDLDEVFVPRKGTTWPELFFKHNLYKPNAGIYMFQHYYFRRNESSNVPYFVTQNSFWRTKEVFPAGKIRCKSMYNAEKAISIDLHFHYKMTPGTTECMVDPTEGALHHYRHEPMEVFRNNPSRFEFVEDKIMEIYRYNVYMSYKDRYSKMYRT